MGSVLTKIDPDLRRTLDSLEAHERLTVLLYVRAPLAGFERLLEARRQHGLVTYRMVRLSNAIAIEASKATLLDLAARGEVVRVRASPPLGLHGR